MFSMVTLKKPWSYGYAELLSKFLRLTRHLTTITMKINTTPTINLPLYQQRVGIEDLHKPTNKKV